MVEVSVFFKLLFHTFSLFMYSVCVCVCVHVRTRVHAQLLSYVQLFGPNYSNPWTIAQQAPLSMEFSRQEYWSVPFPTPGDIPDPGIEPALLVSPALVDSSALCHLGSPMYF